MTLIIIIASLFIEHTVNRLDSLRNFAWLSFYRDTVLSLIPDRYKQGFGGLFLLLAPMVLLVFLLQLLIGKIDWFILEILLGIVVLTYCLGPESLNKQVETYINLVEQGNEAEASKAAEKLIQLNAVPDNLYQQIRLITTSIFYESNVRIFGVLFWFLLLGPLGALLYRFISFIYYKNFIGEDNTLPDEAETLLGIMDWLPARLLGLTFFLSGSFDDALAGWRRASAIKNEEHSFIQRNRAVVISTGCGAMQHEVEDLENDNPADKTTHIQWVRVARMLIIRSLIIWLAVIGVMSLAGWFI